MRTLKIVNKSLRDYSEYIMLDVLNGCGEIVVNSRQLGYVCTDASYRINQELGCNLICIKL